MRLSSHDDWTPVAGWVKAGVQIPSRAAAAMAAAWLGLWLLQTLIVWLEGQTQQEISTIGFGLILLLGIASGLAAGFVLTWKLSEQTGLLGSHLLVPVCVCERHVVIEKIPCLINLCIRHGVNHLMAPVSLLV